MRGVIRSSRSTSRRAAGPLNRFRRVRVHDPLADLGGFAFALAKLGLDGLQLLAQHVLALRVGHFLFGLRSDLAP